MTASSSGVEGFDLDGLRAKAEAATPGPWRSMENFAVFTSVITSEGGIEVASVTDLDEAGAQEDADFIAATDPSTVLALIARVETAEAAVARVRKLHSPVPCLDWDDQTCAHDDAEQWPCPTIRALDGAS